MSKGGLVGSAHSGADRYRRQILDAAGLSENTFFSNLNTTLSIKSSPPKTACATARLCISSGYLTKRNEQKQWQRRFCTLVPHTLLYYFEDENAKTPRGVIDLEYYTEITAEPDNVVRLATPAANPDGTPGPQRTFYFQADSEEEMSEWLSALIRERYFNLRDQRDAYQELQGQFQAQTAHTSNCLASSVDECERAAALGAAAQREESEIAAQLGALLASLDPTGAPAAHASDEGLSEDYSEDDCDEEEEEGCDTAGLARGARRRSVPLDTALLDALLAVGNKLVQRVTGLERTLQASKTKGARRAEALASHDAELAAVRAELAEEAGLLALERRAALAESEEVASLRRELDEGEMNLGIVLRTKDSAAARVAELSEQKKLLVKEVKAARKALQASHSRKEELAEKLRSERFAERAAERAAERDSDRETSPLEERGSTASARSEEERESCASSEAESPRAVSESQRLAGAGGGALLEKEIAYGQTAMRAGASMFRSFLSEVSPKVAKKATLAKEVDVEDEEPISSPPASPPASPVDKKPPFAESAPAPVDEVLRCKRCKGTVEGPRNSTCKCTVPLLGDAVEPLSAAQQATREAEKLWKSFSVFTAARPKKEPNCGETAKQTDAEASAGASANSAETAETAAVGDAARVGDAPAVPEAPRDAARDANNSARDAHNSAPPPPEQQTPPRAARADAASSCDSDDEPANLVSL